MVRLPYLVLCKEVLEVRAGVASALKSMCFSATTDTWTATNNIKYTTCTVHFIDRNTWILQSNSIFPLDFSSKQALPKQKTLFSTVKVHGKQLILTKNPFQPLLKMRLPCVRQDISLSVVLFKLEELHNMMTVFCRSHPRTMMDQKEQC
jgi:hypothetical protein